MRCFRISGRFVDDESGAVTVDWVVLTAVVVTVALVVVPIILPSVFDTSSRIKSRIDAAT